MDSLAAAAATARRCRAGPRIAPAPRRLKSLRGAFEVTPSRYRDGVRGLSRGGRGPRSDQFAAGSWVNLMSKGHTPTVTVRFTTMPVRRYSLPGAEQSPGFSVCIRPALSNPIADTEPPGEGTMGLSVPRTSCLIPGLYSSTPRPYTPTYTL